MDKDLQSRLEELVKEYEIEYQSNEILKIKLNDFLKNSAHRIVDNSEWHDVLVETIEQQSRLEKIQEELLIISTKNKILTINNPELREKLRKIFVNVNHFYKKDQYELGCALGPLSDEDWESWIEDISSSIHDRPWSDSLHDLLNRISPNKFTERGYEVIALVLNQGIPKEFHTLFTDIDLSYRFGLFNSVLVCCRSVIEIGIKNYYGQIKYQKYNEAKGKKEVSLEWLIDSLEETIKLDKRDKEKAHFVRMKANSILHSGAAASQEDAFQSIKNTHYIIKRLYGTYNSNG